MKDVRNKIIERLKAGLEKDPIFYAFWLEGSDGFGHADEYSDLDLWFDVEKGKEKIAFKKIEKWQGLVFFQTTSRRVFNE